MSAFRSLQGQTTGPLRTQTDSRIRNTTKKKEFISHDALVKLYDECSLEKFDKLHRIFYSIYWINSTLIIILSTLSGLAQTPAVAHDGTDNMEDLFSIISLFSGITAAILTAIDRIVSFLKVADACRDARGELAYYLASKEPMPKRNFDKISQIGLLCFKHPTKCEESITTKV